MRNTFLSQAKEAQHFCRYDETDGIDETFRYLAKGESIV